MTRPAVRILIVDDEKPARLRLKALLERHPGVEVAAECPDGPAALDVVSAASRSGAPVELIFLDIQMPEMDGFAFLEALYALPLNPVPVVVFATAYDDYALRAFDAHAVDYLLKPYSDERFDVALTRALRFVQGGGAPAESLVRQMHALLDGLGKSQQSPPPPQAPLSANNAYLDRLALKDRGRVRLLHVSDIRWIAADGVYVTIHTARESYLHREVLSRLESQLDPHRFLRIHRSHIVNFDFVQELEQDAHGDYTVILKDAAPLKVSRMYRPRLEDRLRQRL